MRPGEDPEDGLRREVAEELRAELGGLDGGPVLHRIDPQAGLDLTVWVSRRWRGAVGRGQRQKQEPGREPRPRMRATHTRTKGVRHLLAAYELGEDQLFGHVKPRKTRARFLEFCRYLRSLYPPSTRIAIICDNLSPHLTTAKDGRVGVWAATGAPVRTDSGVAYLPRNLPHAYLFTSEETEMIGLCTPAGIGKALP